MGTKQEALKIQSQLKGLMRELGWTQNQLARIIFAELHEHDNDNEIVAFQEQFKKALQRDTTKIERLQKFLEIAISHPDAKGIKKGFKKYVPQNSIRSSLAEGMRMISLEIDEDLKKERIELD